MYNCGDMSAHVTEELLYCIEEITSKTIIISIDNSAIFLYILHTKLIFFFGLVTTLLVFFAVDIKKSG
jgi:hypothetical protein